MDRENSFQPLGVGVGSLINRRYEIVRVLGSGGMSAVYQVADRSLNRDLLALKLFAPAINKDDTLVERIQNEVMMTRKMSHPNIVRTYDFGVTTLGQYFMTMEYVEGTSLDKIIDAAGGKRLNIADCLRILSAIAEAVSYAHSCEIIHRDLKPANVIIGVDGQVKVADFGLARMLNTGKKLTQVGECVGTPHYMSPEQVQDLPVDARTDIYSMGIIAYELVVGHVPFQAPGWFNLANQIISESLPDLPKTLGIPEWYKEFVLVATAKVPDQRYQNVLEVLAVLEKHAEAPTEEKDELSKSKFAKIFHSQVLSRRDRYQSDAHADRRSLWQWILTVSPTKLVLICVALLLLAVVLSLAKGNQSPTMLKMNTGAQAVNGMAEAMSKMTKVVGFLVENESKIAQLAEKIEAAQVSENIPVVQADATVEQKDEPASAKKAPSSNLSNK